MNLHWSRAAVSIAVVLALGCASAGPRPTAIAPVPDGIDFSKYRSFDVVVESSNDLGLADPVLARIREKVILQVADDHPRRFVQSGPIAGEPYVRARVVITRHEPGSERMRFWLGPIDGRIHIDGDVFLYDGASTEWVGEFEVRKTFAWGGRYGSQTTIREVEEGFAESVANLIATK
jgi:hypothetical protein